MNFRDEAFGFEGLEGGGVACRGAKFSGTKRQKRTRRGVPPS